MPLYFAIARPTAKLMLDKGVLQQSQDKTPKVEEIRCSCDRYLFTIIDKEIFVKCRRCKKNHKVEVAK